MIPCGRLFGTFPKKYFSNPLDSFFVFCYFLGYFSFFHGEGFYALTRRMLAAVSFKEF